MSFRSDVQSLSVMSTMESKLVTGALAMNGAIIGSNVLIEIGFGTFGREDAAVHQPHSDCM